MTGETSVARQGADVDRVFRFLIRNEGLPFRHGDLLEPLIDWRPERIQRALESIPLGETRFGEHFIEKYGGGGVFAWYTAYDKSAAKREEKMDRTYWFNWEAHLEMTSPLDPKRAFERGINRLDARVDVYYLQFQVPHMYDDVIGPGSTPIHVFVVPQIGMGEMVFRYRTSIPDGLLDCVFEKVRTVDGLDDLKEFSELMSRANMEIELDGEDNHGRYLKATKCVLPYGELNHRCYELIDRGRFFQAYLEDLKL